ncbi:MAG: hypothetical protein R3B09_06400 [Nannocystaceae bacterium]
MRRRTPSSVALAALLVTSGGCAHSHRLRGAAASACAAPEAAFDGRWDPARRARVDARARSIPVDHLRHLAGRVAGSVDRAVALWIRGRRGACEHAGRGGAERLAAAIACQDAAAAGLEVALRRFESADAAAIEGSDMALERWIEWVHGCTWTQLAGDEAAAAWSIEVAALEGTLADDASAAAVAERALRAASRSGSAGAW